MGLVMKIPQFAFCCIHVHTVRNTWNNRHLALQKEQVHPCPPHCSVPKSTPSPIPIYISCTHDPYLSASCIAYLPRQRSPMP